MPKLSAKETLSRHHDEEVFLLDKLDKSPEMTLGMAEIRSMMKTLSSIKNTNPEAAKKRIQRLIARLEDSGLVVRLDKDQTEITPGSNNRTVYIRKKDGRTPFSQMASILEAPGESQAAIAATLLLASRTLEKQLPRQYFDKLKPIFSYAEEAVQKIRNKNLQSGHQSWDPAALIDAIYVTQKGIQQRHGPKTVEALKISEPKIGEAQSCQKSIIDSLHEAIAKHRTIRFQYSGKRRKAATHYECGPLGIVFRSPKVYLIGMIIGSSDKPPLMVRAWSLDRISELNITHFHFSRPDDFNLVDYVEHESNLESVWNPAKPDPVAISFRVLPKPIPGHGEGLVTEEFMEMRLEGQQDVPKPHRDKSLTVQLRRKDTIEFRRWLLGYGDAIAEVKGLPGWKE
jgi:hypothetical protein